MKNLRHSSMIREMHFLFLLFECHIWMVTFHHIPCIYRLLISKCFLKIIQKQGSQYRSIISTLNKIFEKHFIVFNVFPDIATNFIKLFSLIWIRTTHIHVCKLHSLFLLLVRLFICLSVNLFVLLSCYYCFYVIFLSQFLHIFIFVWVGIL